MRWPILIFVGASLLVIVSLWKTSSKHQPGQEQSRNQASREDPTSLRARAKKAKPDANNEVVFETPVPILADVGGLDEALANYSVIIGQPVDKFSIQIDSRNIATYYRFRIVETLLHKQLTFAGVPENLPNELPPLTDGEIYVIEGGGSVVIDEVKVTQKPLHEYTLHKKYLLFVSRNAAGTTAMVNLGKYGVFKIKPDNDDALEPMVTDTPVARDLKDHYSNRISKLKTALKRP